MYTLTVDNHYSYDIAASNGDTIPQGENLVFNNMGSIILTIPGMGDVNFIDLGDKKLEGYPEPKETWGVLVRYCAKETYYRYEGQGQLTATVDNFGACTIATINGSMIPISLPKHII